MTMLRWKVSERHVLGGWEDDEAIWEGFEFGMTRRERKHHGKVERELAEMNGSSLSRQKGSHRVAVLRGQTRRPRALEGPDGNASLERERVKSAKISTS